MGYNSTIGLLACAFCSWTGQAAGATDGSAGTTSQGSLRISLSVEPHVRLSNLQDIRLTPDGSMQVSAHRELCIYSRTGQYQLQAQGSGADASFRLSQAGRNAEPNQRVYQVQYSDGSGLKPLASGVPLGGLSGADTSSQTCGTTGLNGRLLISSNPKSDQLQRAGHYTGTLTLLVAPE
jgi:hypothetical protein